MVGGVQVTRRFVSQGRKVGFYFKWDGKPLLGLCRGVI